MDKWTQKLKASPSRSPEVSACSVQGSDQGQRQTEGPLASGKTLSFLERVWPTEARWADGMGLGMGAHTHTHTHKISI